MIIYSTDVQLSNDRCWICGYKKVTRSEMVLLPYLCSWCSREQIVTLINDIITDAEEHLNQGELGRCEDIDTLSFIADIGELGIRHPYLNQFSRILSTMAVQLALEHRYTFDKLLKVVDGGNVPTKMIRVYECITFLRDVGLLEDGEGRYIYERYKPSSLLLDLTASVEVVDVEKGLPPRVAGCITGYAWLRGISATINWLKEGAKGGSKGIAKLYPRSEDGKLLIPKLFTAPTMYMLGYLASGYNEFSEDELRAWLNPRGISGNDANFIVNLLARVIPSNHRLINPFYDGHAYHFKFNISYIRMRERYRERRRGRSTT